MEPAPTTRMSATPQERPVRQGATLLAVLWALFIAGLTSLRVIWHPTLVERMTGDATKIGLLMFVASLPWVLRPVWAAVSDRTVVDGRRHHVLLAAGAIFFAVACLIAPHTHQVLAASLLLGVGQALVVASLVGVVVTLGRATRLDGLLAAAQIALPSLAALLLPFGQKLAGGSIAITLCGAGLLTLSVGALAWPGSRTPPLSSPAPSHGTPPPLRQIFATRELWMTALVLALVQTDLVDSLSLQSLARGVTADVHERALRLATWGTAAGALLYWLACRRVRLRHLLPVTIVLSAATKLLFLTPVAPDSVVLAGLIVGLGRGVVGCAIVHLTMRAAPVGHEAFVFIMLGAAHAVGAAIGMMVLPLVVGPGDTSAMAVFALVAGAVGLLATRLVPRAIIDPHD